MDRQDTIEENLLFTGAKKWANKMTIADESQGMAKVGLVLRSLPDLFSIIHVLNFRKLRSALGTDYSRLLNLPRTFYRRK